MKLTENFDLSEMIVSQTASRQGIDKDQGAGEKYRIHMLAQGAQDVGALKRWRHDEGDQARRLVNRAAFVHAEHAVLHTGQVEQ